MLVEGVRLIEKTLRAGIVPALIFFATQAQDSPRAVRLLAATARTGASLWEIIPAFLGPLRDTVTSQSVIAATPIPELALPAKRRFLPNRQRADCTNIRIGVLFTLIAAHA